MKERYKTTVTFLLFCLLILIAFIIVSRPKKEIAKVPAPVKFKGKIAIVLDDWGYNLNNLTIASKIKYPLTASVLPNLAYSSTVSLELHKLGFEIILHLPMEPHEKYRLEKNTILTSLSAAQISQIVAKDLDSIVYCTGVSNHMGSKVTENPRVMQDIFQEVKKRKLFFLDSVVSSKSIGSKLAAENQVSFAKRDIFLDNQENPSYIKGQLSKLKNKAKTTGEAIGIGHDRRITLLVLKEMMPEIEREGYKFVYLSELVR